MRLKLGKQRGYKMANIPKFPSIAIALLIDTQ